MHSRVGRKEIRKKKKSKLKGLRCYLKLFC